MSLCQNQSNSAVHNEIRHSLFEISLIELKSHRPLRVCSDLSSDWGKRVQAKILPIYAKYKVSSN